MIDLNKIYQGHVLDVFRSLPEGIVNCCVTSPPYWGLRDYGLEPLIWDGDENCDHVWGLNFAAAGANCDTFLSDKQKSNKGSTGRDKRQTSNFCIHCSSWRGQLGLEPTPELYVKHIVDIFREVKRVLKKDGTVFLNLGDSYYGSKQGRNADGTVNNKMTDKQKSNKGSLFSFISSPYYTDIKPENSLKPKDLVGIPWMVAFALRADGWYLRSDIIWQKPNTMPESVKDRPTNSHEYLFLLSKSAKYYYDADAISEPLQLSTFERSKYRLDGFNKQQINKDAKVNYINPKTAAKTNERMLSGVGRNKRSVWTVNTQPFKGAHFAVFPSKLIVDCIKAGCPEKGVVLDPFFGSGTVGEVALRLDRKFIGIELNQEYIEIAKKRLKPYLESLPLDFA